LTPAPADPAAWARAHHAGFEVTPLVEMVKGRQLQVGFTITFYARLPVETPAGPERRTAAAEIREGLRGILDSLALPQGSRARLEVESARTAVVIEPEGRREPEVVLSARVFHGDDYFAAATADEEKRLRDATRQLVEMGLTERRRRVH
jgi:hypothetical protein